MFDLLLQMGAKLDIKNRQGLTPLTMSAMLPRKDVSMAFIHVKSFLQILKLEIDIRLFYQEVEPGISTFLSY